MATGCTVFSGVAGITAHASNFQLHAAKTSMVIAFQLRNPPLLMASILPRLPGPWPDPYLLPHCYGSTTVVLPWGPVPMGALPWY